MVSVDLRTCCRGVLFFFLPPLVLAAEDSHSHMGGSDDACPYYWDMHHIVVGLPFLRLVWDFILSLGSLRI